MKYIHNELFFFKFTIIYIINRDAYHSKKHDERFLGKDLDVACFLLAIEVERLYEENMYWK